MNTPNSRAIAAGVLAELVLGRGSLTTQLNKYQDLPDYSLLQETCYGCCRWFHLLDFILSQLLAKPLKTKDIDLKCLLVVGLYQLRELSIPDYAVIDESVSAANSLGKTWGKSLVNGVLRNYLRSRNEIEQVLDSDATSILYSHPRWLIAEIEKQWPQQAPQIFSNNNLRPPMTLRVNRCEKSREEILVVLAKASIEAIAGDLAESAVYLDQPAAVTTIPGFNEGWVSVQDEASQLVPGLLELEPNLRVLDACAAPGGKTCHMLESEHSLTELVALDLDSSRLSKIDDNLDRLHLRATLKAVDAADTDRWWDGQPFHRILLDAPCSATGIIRRHPDIKLLRRPKDIKRQMAAQHALLQSLWPCLKPGGLLLYTTCSILRQENEEIIAAFLDTVDNAKHQRIAADWGVECHYGRQLLPGTSNGPDGFFYSLLRKD
ncbi:MAG: 16S rRNA (cytosine(967)-C(5))-methyltransferase RsmB [Proteobacteria bacterium]|nr:16S rRNA (cytosine(967)-C(5))-methyltransferase RsmB [Pseudomonadota bacterium]